MENAKKHWFKVAILAVVVVSVAVVLWMVYQSTVAIPKQKILSEQQQFEENKAALEGCLAEVEQRVVNGWSNDCKKDGLEENCALSLDVVARWDKIANDGEARCVELYKN